MLCIFVVILLFVGVVNAESTSLSVYFIDVGQGDSTLLISGDDVMLVDTGPSDGLSALRDQLE